MKEIYKDIITVGLVASALIYLCKSSSPRPTTLDITPKLGKHLEQLQTTTFHQGVKLQVNDKDNSRQIHFYDWGFNGTLDEVGIMGNGTYHTYNPKDIKAWTPAYNEIKQRLSGTNFEPIYDHFKKENHVSYVNRLEKITEK